MATERPGLGNPEVVDFENGVHAVLGMETVEGVHAANVGIITTPRALVFVNSGQTEAQANFVWNLAQSKAPAREMLYLVLTHHHLDHCFAASFFDERNALIYAHKSFSECMAEMRKHLAATDYHHMLCAFLKIDDEKCRRVVGAVHPVTPHRHVGEEVSLAVNGEEIHVMHLPGHTRCELVVYHPQDEDPLRGRRHQREGGARHDVRRREGVEALGVGARAAQEARDREDRPGPRERLRAGDHRLPHRGSGEEDRGRGVGRAAPLEHRRVRDERARPEREVPVRGERCHINAQPLENEPVAHAGQRRAAPVPAGGAVEPVRQVDPEVGNDLAVRRAPRRGPAWRSCR